MEPTTSPATADKTQKNNSSVWWIIGIVVAVLGVMVLACLCLMAAAVVFFATSSSNVRFDPPQQQFQLPERVPMPPMAPEIAPIPLPTLPFEFDLPGFTLPTSGALVSEVVPDSPAERAGLQPGAIIVALDGVPITPEQSLASLIGRYRPGDDVTVSFIQLGEGRLNQQDVVVTLGANPEDAERAYLGIYYRPIESFVQPEP